MTEIGPNPLATGAEISVADARAAIHALIRPIQETQTLPLTQAVGRILAQDLISPINVPAHDNSAMDGFAFDGGLLRPEEALTLHLVGSVYAGQAPTAGVSISECVRIMTGAVMPYGLDTIAPLELCTVDADQVIVKPGAVRAGDNRRRQGEDLAIDQTALHAGRILRPADIGLVASLGCTQLTVMRRLKVAVFSTGDEVVAPGQPLPPNCIYDSNRYALMAAIQRLGMDVIDLGLIRDDPAALRATLAAAVDQADVVITSGGVSAGDADYMRDVIAQVGEISFWKVAMRPGRPFAFGSLHAGQDREVCLFALPGNPVASLVSFYVFAREALLALAGAQIQPLPVMQARSTKALRKRPGRTEFQRGFVNRNTDGEWQISIAGSQGAGVLSSMSVANALIVLRQEQGSVAAGELVDVWLFDGLT